MRVSVDDEVQSRITIESCSSNLSSTATSSMSESENYGFSSSAGVVKLNEDEEDHVLLKHRLYTSIGSLAQHCSVVAIHKSLHSSPYGRARFETFRLYSKATEQRRNGNGNVVSGWYSAPKDRIHRILTDGFDISGVPEDGGIHGFGLCVFSDSSAIDSVLSSPVCAAGLRHVMFCRVISGSMEEIPPGSRQSCPSSDNFDSGVDNRQYPRKFIIWYPHANTHILPLYIVSFKLDFRTEGMQTEPPRRPSSPWMPFNALITVLSKCLPPSAMRLIRKYHSDYMERKITRQQLILHVRQISGDKLLISSIKSFRDKQMKASNCSSSKTGKGSSLDDLACGQQI